MLQCSHKSFYCIDSAANEWWRSYHTKTNRSSAEQVVMYSSISISDMPMHPSLNHHGISR
jgi:hypothetical protein